MTQTHTESSLLRSSALVPGNVDNPEYDYFQFPQDKPSLKESAGMLARLAVLAAIITKDALVNMKNNR